MVQRLNRRWLVAKRTVGDVRGDNFRWVEEPAPTPADGQFLVRNRWFSFDPTQIYMLGRADRPEGESGGAAIGEVMGTIAVSEVVESRHPGFQPGDLVHGHTGWEDYSIADGGGFTPTFKIPEGASPNWALGPLGITGIVAYFGVTETARPRAGETFVISGAAGGVGSIACLLAKLRGLKVIGIAGSPSKCRWLLDEAKIDGAIDYREEDVGKRLGELCPEGVDIFFDNDGGSTLDLILDRLRPGGRIVLCGATSRYPVFPPPPGPSNYLSLVMVNGRMEGLLGRDFVPRYPELVAEVLPLLKSGKLRPKEDVAFGLRNAPATLARLFAGENVGKQLLKLDDPPESDPGT